jgi:hypothetical protein
LKRLKPFRFEKVKINKNHSAPFSGEVWVFMLVQDNFLGSTLVNPVLMPVKGYVTQVSL